MSIKTSISIHIIQNINTHLYRMMYGPFKLNTDSVLLNIKTDIDLIKARLD